MPLNMINDALNSLRNAASFTNVEVYTKDSRKKTLGFKSTTLGTKIDETINGIQSLTSGLEEKTVAQLTKDIPGLEVELVKKVDGDRKNKLDKITGGTVDDGFLDITITAPTPEGIKASLNVALPDVPVKPFEDIFSNIVPEDFEDDINSLIDNDFLDITVNFQNEIDKFENNLKNTIFGNTNNILLNTILNDNKKVYIELNGLGININTQNEMIRLINNGNRKEAAQLAQDNGSPLSRTEIDTVVNNIDLSPSAQLTDFSVSKTSKLYDTNNNTEMFSEVSTLEELMIEMIRCNREITQVIFFGYTSDPDQFLTAEDINTLETHVGENMTNMHYIIRKDGVIQRGRPLATQSEFDDNHNKYTICVGIVYDSDKCNMVQSASIEAFIKSFYNTWTGGKVFSANTYDDEWERPGIDIANIIKTMGKINFGTYEKSLSTEELIQAGIDGIRQAELE